MEGSLIVNGGIIVFLANLPFKLSMLRSAKPLMGDTEPRLSFKPEGVHHVMFISVKQCFFCRER
jgi:hypothetical protein